MKLVEVAESRKRARWLKLDCVNTFALIEWDQESGVRSQGVSGCRREELLPHPDTSDLKPPDP